MRIFILVHDFQPKLWCMCKKLIIIFLPDGPWALRSVVRFYHCVTSLCRPGARSAASIILRGANDFMVDEMERSVHDALCVVKRVLESNRVVPGGGAVETALSMYLENFATSIVSRSRCDCVHLL